jgi:hypothetical protein
VPCCSTYFSTYTAWRWHQGTKLQGSSWDTRDFICSQVEHFAPMLSWLLKAKENYRAHILYSIRHQGKAEPLYSPQRFVPLNWGRGVRGTSPNENHQGKSWNSTGSHTHTCPNGAWPCETIPWLIVLLSWFCLCNPSTYKTTCTSPYFHQWYLLSLESHQHTLNPRVITRSNLQQQKSTWTGIQGHVFKSLCFH